MATSAITGLVRSEIIPDKKEYTHSLADRTHIPYKPVNPDDPNLVLTIRERNDAPRRPLPRSAWKIVEGTHISMAEGFEPGKIYELVYTSKDPALVGLGPTATRDFISYLEIRRGKHHDAALRSKAVHQARLRIRRLSERTLSAHVSLLRLQRGRTGPQGVRRRDGARRGGGPRQLRYPLRPAVARRPSVHEPVLSDRHLPLHR